MTAVWDDPLPAGQKLVLLCLADHANDDGSNAWPSVERIGRLCSLSSRAVQYHLRELQRTGRIEVTSAASQHKPTAYRVTPRGAESAPRKVCAPQITSPGVQIPAPRGAESAPDPKRTKRTTSMLAGRPTFDLFWRDWPKKVGKQEAFDYWLKHVRLDEVPAIMVGVQRERVRGPEELKFLKDPVRWLKGRRWEDELEPTEGAAPSPYAGTLVSEQCERCGVVFQTPYGEEPEHKCNGEAAAG